MRPRGWSGNNFHNLYSSYPRDACFQLKVVAIGLVVSKNLKCKIVNRRLTTHRRRPIAIGHLSDSGNLKRRKRKF